ncbi:SPOSA6832_03081 [Sporobolomyces salmonicolor]|uniref:Adenine DNA glycosylase n=1 Tax=Sporidiobolus salmonicolor TaxID=5005 RepID=A0A0D6EP68_SPOSA|nr:SPOSA6832_03081 [Sporobolomyces salmonicolor]
MPPRKKNANASTAPLPSPNLSHPCASLLPAVLASSTLADRPHPASYHCFLTSPYYPSPAVPASSPPPKKKRKKDEPALPNVLDEAIDAKVLQRKLLGWFDGVKESRGMPWRKEVVPADLTREERAQRGYEVWVSEIMLQQTQVSTVIPYWTKWMARFPTVSALAMANIEDVNSCWSGLGYYSRAKRLLEGAQTVVREYAGRLPETVELLLGIDGIGPYSAGTISSIAFGQRSPMVDGNVTRVLSRLTAFHAPATAKSTTSFIWALADVLVPVQVSSSSSPSGKQSDEDEGGLDDVGGPNKPGAWNQALMELGATVCTPKGPKCGECPLSEECLAYAESRFVAHRHSAKSPAPFSVDTDIEDLCTLCSSLPYDDDGGPINHAVEVYPMAKERKKQREEDTAVCVVEWVPSGGAEAGKEAGGKVLLIKRPEKGLLAGLFEFPAVDLPASPSAPSSPKSRAKLLNSLLPTLLDVPDPSILSSPSSGIDGNKLTLLSRIPLPPVTHVYSHMIRTYHAERVVFTSPALPALLPASSAKRSSKSGTGSKDEKATLVQSLPGRGKWVDAEEVKGENIGGAVGKVWEEREAAVSGKARVGGKKGASGSAKGKKKEKEKEEKDGKQGSLMGWFGTKGGAEKAKVTPKGKEEEDDEEVVVVEETVSTKVQVRSAGSGAAVEVNEAEKKVYKKRRIAPSSDSEAE